MWRQKFPIVDSGYAFLDNGKEDVEDFAIILTDDFSGTARVLGVLFFFLEKKEDLELIQPHRNHSREGARAGIRPHPHAIKPWRVPIQLHCVPHTLLISSCSPHKK